MDEEMSHGELRSGSGLTRDRRLRVVIAVGFVLVAVPVWWGIAEGWNYSWAVDGLDLDDVYLAVSNRFMDGWHTRYPPFHYALLAALFSVPMGLDWLGALDLWAGDASFPLFLVARGASVAMAMGCLICTYAVAVEAGLRPRYARAAVMLVMTSLPFVYYGKTTNLDVPYTLWFLVSVLFLLRFNRTHALRDASVCLGAAALSVATKDQAYGLIVGICIAFLVVAWREREGINTRLLWVPVLIGLGTGIVAFGIPWNLRGFLAHAALITGEASVPYRQFDATLAGQWRLLGSSCLDAALAAGWPLLAMGVAGGLGAVRHARADVRFAILVLPMLSYYALFIGAIGYSVDRFYLPCVPLLSVLGIGVVARSASTTHGTSAARRAGVAVLVVAIGYNFTRAVALDWYLLKDERSEATSWLERNVSVSDRITTLGGRSYLPFMDLRNGVQRINGSDASDIEELLGRINGAYVVTSDVFPPIRFEPEGTGLAWDEVLNAESGYEKVFVVGGDVPMVLSDLKSERTNLGMINPEIGVYRAQIPRED